MIINFHLTIYYFGSSISSVKNYAEFKYDPYVKKAIEYLDGVTITSVDNKWCKKYIDFECVDEWIELFIEVLLFIYIFTEGIFNLNVSMFLTPNLFTQWWNNHVG